MQRVAERGEAVNKIEFVKFELPELTKEEIEEEERYFAKRRFYCPACKQVTTFVRCPVCDKRFCLNHAYEETESIDGHPIATYPICYHCEEP